MSIGAAGMLVIVILGLGSLLFLIFAMARSMRNEHTSGRSVWKEFGLGIALLSLFFATWIAHGVAEWQVYTDEQRTHDQPVEVGDFASEFAQATLENWQSEFLQLFAFVSLAALFVFKSSAESKDGEEKIEASLRRIEQNLGTLPDAAPDAPGDEWKLPHPRHEEIGS